MDIRDLFPSTSSDDRRHVKIILSDHLKPNTTNGTLPDLPPGTVAHFHRLREGFIFSRWFILTYQPAAIGIVAVVALWRWYRRRARSRRRKTRRVLETRLKRDGNGLESSAKDDVGVDHAGISPSSSSSSTRIGNATPPNEEAKTSDEWTKLLDEEHDAKSMSQETSRFKTIPRWLRYFLACQPPPIPIVNKVLPENTTTLYVLALFALQLFYLFFNIDLTPSTQDLIGDRAGLLFTANLPWLYLLAAKTQPLKLLTGDSYENLNLLHRRLGEWMCLLAAIHLGGMLWGWWDFLRPTGFTLLRFLTIPYILWGSGAWVAYEALYLTSLGSFREWWYEAFLGSHVSLQAGALVMLWLHHFRSRPPVSAALLIFGLDRFVWRLGIKSCCTQADLKVLEDGETVLVSADWAVRSKQRSSWRRVFGWDIRYGWHPSEHVFISTSDMGTKNRFQFHPMTIASAAPASGQTHAWFNLIIRAKKGFSRDLLRHAQHTRSLNIRLDGPYGSLHAFEMLHDSDISIVVAGGSGIAVAYPLLWSALHHNSQLDQDLSSHHRKQQFCLIWIIQDASHISWIGQERLEELKALGLHLIIPPPSRQHGRSDVRALLRERVEDLKESVEQSVGVIVSGPDGLNRSTRNECAEMLRKGLKVEVAVEKFGW